MRACWLKSDPTNREEHSELMLTHCQPSTSTRTDLGRGRDRSCAALNDYDLILLDLNLPDMNGLESCASWRVAANDTPILVPHQGGSNGKAQTEKLWIRAPDETT